MEVQGLDPTRRAKQPPAAPKGGAAARAKEPFAAKLLEVVDIQARDLIERKLAEVDREAGELGRKPSKENLRRYRQTVGDFLDEVLKRAYRLEETMTMASGGRTKIHLKIENVNKSLDELADLVMRDQAESLLMLKKLDEIRGMIKDIYK